MSEQLWSKLFGNLPIIIIFGCIFGGGILTAIVSLITNAWKGNREGERLAVLKQQMLDRGMSADEIVRVVEAGATKAALEE